jgi:hypothetical protein
MTEGLSGGELVALIQRVFRPTPHDRGLAILVDLPDEEVPDTAAWRQRRQIAADWARELSARAGELGLHTNLVAYRNVRTNNGDLPPAAWVLGDGPLPDGAGELDPGTATPFSEIYATHSILVALTQFSATAPLKVAARAHPIRAATMPGFTPAMIPALRLDWGEINRRVEILADLLTQAEAAEIDFRYPGGSAHLTLDLRFRHAHASGGLLPTPGVAGNLPSGEAYIVPYEGEREGEPSRSRGELPVQLEGGEVVVYRVEENRATEVLSLGTVSRREAAAIAAEPAYANLAELGFGVLAELGIKPIGEVLLDEKLGLHIAFGRSDHFGGQVGPGQFSSPAAVIHIDRVYIPETQPDVRVEGVDLLMPGGEAVPVMRNHAYVLDWSR